MVWQDHVTADRKIIVCVPCLKQQRVRCWIGQNLSPVFRTNGYQQDWCCRLKCREMRRMLSVWKYHNSFYVSYNISGSALNRFRNGFKKPRLLIIKGGRSWLDASASPGSFPGVASDAPSDALGVVFTTRGWRRHFRPRACLAEAWAEEEPTQPPDLGTSSLNGVVYPKFQILGRPPIPNSAIGPPFFH